MPRAHAMIIDFGASACQSKKMIDTAREDESDDAHRRGAKIMPISAYSASLTIFFLTSLNAPCWRNIVLIAEGDIANAKYEIRRIYL